VRWLADPLDNPWIREAIDVQVELQHVGVQTDVHPVGRS
jgi:hypothetical protein